LPPWNQSLEEKKEVDYSIKKKTRIVTAIGSWMLGRGDAKQTPPNEFSNEGSAAAKGSLQD
jgi:hypothetical protein